MTRWSVPYLTTADDVGVRDWVVEGVAVVVGLVAGITASWGVYQLAADLPVALQIGGVAFTAAGIGGWVYEIVWNLGAAVLLGEGSE